MLNEMLTIVILQLRFLTSIHEVAAFPSDLSSDYLSAHSCVRNEEYVLCGYRVTWDEARVMCSGYKAELAAVDTDRKARIALRAIASSDLPIAEHLWIGAREATPGSWFWISGENRSILRDVPRRNYSLRYPNTSNEDLRCLSMMDRMMHRRGAPIFVPLRCDQRKPFICRRDESERDRGSAREVGTARVDEEEFVLYSTRLTWPETVIQCRKEGLQIAEVKTTAQAQSLAFLMIRARPESIESAWIGGYTNGSTWKWLPSGSNVPDNDLWRDDDRKFHGCLLLDRHVCELPVYLAAKCDRKRDVVCQRPPKKRANERPSPVYIEECLYWIGFRSLTWSQANLSCRELNASLVILDSPRIINHMMSLMEDNAEELRHIWTDGRREFTRTVSGDTTLGRWAWESTGEPVPEIGASFIPWCSAGQCHDHDANCLNLDRAGYDTPVVYALSCNQSQTYVCQPWSGTCVSRESRNLNASYVALSSGDNPPPTLSPSKTTVPYYDERVVRKSLHADVSLSINTNHSTSSPAPRNEFNFTNGEKKSSGVKSTTTFLIPSYYNSGGPIEVKLTSKNAENNITISAGSNFLNKLTIKFKYLPVRVLDKKPVRYRVKIHPSALHPSVSTLINRYYLYYPQYYVRSDRKKMLYRNKKDQNTHNYAVTPRN